MVAPARQGEEPYKYDARSFLAGFFAGRGVKGHGDPDTQSVSVTLSAPPPDEEWRYDNRSFKTGLAIGMTIHVPGQGRGNDP